MSKNTDLSARNFKRNAGYKMQQIASTQASVLVRKKGFDEIILTLVLGMAVSSARAHDPATLDSLPSLHGGQVRMAGPFHVELVILGQEGDGVDRLILLYLQNHLFEDVASTGLKAVARINDGQRVITVNLLQSMPNGFTGAAAFAVSPSVTAEISLIDKNGEIWSATYTPFARKLLN